jgi:hypothetical protein
MQVLLDAPSLSEQARDELAFTTLTIALRGTSSFAPRPVT